MATNPAFDYSSRDYSNIRVDLLRRAAVVAPEWTDRDASDFGMLLVDLWSYMGDILHYYIDRSAQEAFIQTATQRESVLSFANLYGYTPNFRTSSEAVVYISNSGPASVEIPINTRFVALHNDVYYSFFSKGSASVPAGQLSTIEVMEGTLIEEEVLTESSSGYPNQRYIVRDTEAVPNRLQVYVYEEGIRKPWIRYRSVGDMPIGAPGFVVTPNPEGTLEVYFGDRASGRIPPAGSKITISYIVSSGRLGNLPENSIYDFESLSNEFINVEGSSPSIGGDDGEEVESIRRSLQSIVKAQDRAVTLGDYRSLALTVSGVYDAEISYEIALAAQVDPSYGLTVFYDSAAANNAAGISLVTIHPLPLVSNYLEYEGFSIAIPSDLANSIIETVQEKAMLGVTVDVATEIVLKKVNISMTLTVDKRYVAAWVKSDVEVVLDSFFEFGSVKFGKEISLGELYKAIFGVEGVENCVITVLEMRNNLGALVQPGDLGPVELIRKGTYTITTTGGITTSV